MKEKPCKHWRPSASLPSVCRWWMKPPESIKTKWEPFCCHSVRLDKACPSEGESPYANEVIHQSQLPPEHNKFHQGNSNDGKHYWLTPPELYAELDKEFHFTFDPCPYPLPEGFDGLTCEWGESNYVNPPFGSIIHQGKKKGPTAWVRKAIEEQSKGKRVVLVYPIDKWVLMLLSVIGTKEVRNLGDVRWLSIEDGQPGKGTGRHIAAFILEPK